MSSHQLKAQIQALQKAGLLKKGVSTLNQAEECLRKACWSDQIAIVWTVRDVLDQAKDMGIKITKDQARDVLDKVLANEDASRGVNWDTLAHYIREVAVK